MRASVLGSVLSVALAVDCSSSINATSQADLDAISSCTSFGGDITVVGSPTVLTLNGVQSIGGSLTINNATTLGSFSAPDLRQVNDTLLLQSLIVLDTLSLPQLTQVETLHIQTAPALRELQFNAGIQESRNVIISDTALESLNGLNLSQVDTFNINNNKQIDAVLSGMTSVTDALDISFNSPNVNVSLPYLKWANNATFRFCASVGIPAIEKVNQSFGLINNSMQSLNFDQIQEIGGSLSISSNSNLSNVSFSSLKSLGGGFEIANNTKLRSIVGFNKLAKVSGAVQFLGNFTQASLPSLDEVDGGVDVESNAPFNCSTFDSAHKKGDFHGDRYVCKGASVSKSYSLSGSKTASGSVSGGSGSGAQATVSSSSDSSSSSSSRRSSNAAAPVVGTSIVGSLAMALLQFL